MKIYINIVFLFGIVMTCFAQINFNGCHPLFENQEYVFDFDSTDATGRNVYTTVPLDGDQTCGGIGTCEFMIAWNDTNSVWEFIADDGNGDFSSPYLVYSNTSTSTPNPPDLLLGTWVENATITEGDCGGDLSTSNASFTGNVQSTILGIEENQLENMVKTYPNPVDDVIIIKTNLQIDAVEIYNVNGKIVLSKYDDFYRVNVSSLYNGIYFLKIKFIDKFITRKIAIY